MVARIVKRLFGAPDGYRWFGRNLCGGFHCSGQCSSSVRQYFIHQTVLQCFVGWQSAPGVSQFFDHGHGHELGQPLQGADISHHAYIDFLNAKEGVRAGVTQARGSHHVYRAAYAAALDGDDDRHAQSLQACESGLQAAQHVEDGGASFGTLVVHADRFAESFQRHTGAEMFARAADDQHTRLIGLVKLLQHLVEFSPHGHV